MMVKREQFFGAAIIVTSFLGAALPLVLCLEEGQDDTESVFVNISSTTGNNTQCGMDFYNFITQCRSLEHVATLVPENFTGSLTVYASLLVIEKPVVFKGLNEVKLIGYPSTIICNRSYSDNPGLIFTAIKSVIVENFNVLECGTAWNHIASISSSLAVQAAIHISNVSNIIFTHVAISKSSGAGLVIFHNSGGAINITVINSSFIQNANPPTGRVTYLGGNGVYLQLENSQSPLHIYVSFDNCDFMDNTASNVNNTYTFLSGFGQTIVGNGAGGGMRIAVRNSTAITAIILLNCSFTGNSAFLGAGLSVSVGQNSDNVFLALSQSKFERNGCMTNGTAGSGGGASFGMYGFTAEPSRNHFLIRNVQFKHNCALVGGGTTFYSGRSMRPFVNTVNVSQSSWVGNVARLAAAVDIAPHVRDRLTKGFFPIHIFSDCRLENNKAVYHMRDVQKAHGTGTFFCSIVSVEFRHSVHFENNSGSALIMVNGILDFSSANATFIRNTALQGGAIVLIGTSSMQIGPGQHYHFIENTAREHGGAIYVKMIDEHDFTVSLSCFIQYVSNDGSSVNPSEWNATLNFKANRAQRFGHSIFATSMLPCLRSLLNHTAASGWNITSLQKLTAFMFDENDSTLSNQVATDGSHFVVSTDQPFYIIPGERHELMLQILDDFQQRTDVNFRASIVNNTMIEVDSAFSCISSNIVQLHGDKNSAGSLLLESDSPQKASVIVTTLLVSCPPGFHNDNGTCECRANSYRGLTLCNTIDLYANVSRGFWVGIVNVSGTEMLSTAVCFQGFCQYSNNSISGFNNIQLPQDVSKLSETICGPIRHGVLCGKCNEGYVVYFHSPYYSCKTPELCIYGWIFYILSEIIPITILFVTVLVLNISFTSGAINGFILYAQLLDTMLVDVEVINYSKSIQSARWGYRLFYGLFSLDFFNIEHLSFCLFKGATTLDILAFKFLSVGYAFFLIVAVIVYLHYCGHRLAKYVRITTINNSCIHGISAFVILSYVQCIKVSLNILLPQTLRGENDITLSKRVFINGEVEQFSRDHLPYAIPAIFCLLIFGFLPPLVLIIYPLRNYPFVCCSQETNRKYKYFRSKLHQLSPSKLKPFLDSFQGYLKGDLHFFAGVYFLYRWIGLVVFSFSPTYGIFYFSLEIALVALLLIHTIAQPYKIRWQNIVDTLLFANLIIINTLTAASYCFSRSFELYFNDNLIAILGCLQLVFIYSPILFFTGFILATLCQNIRKHIHTQSGTGLAHGFIKLKRHFIDSNKPTDSLEDFPPRVLGNEVEYEISH